MVAETGETAFGEFVFVSVVLNRTGCCMSGVCLEYVWSHHRQGLEAIYSFDGCTGTTLGRKRAETLSASRHLFELIPSIFCQMEL